MDSWILAVRTIVIFRSAVLCIFVAVLSACVMYMPAARDDFSVLGDDLFSNLIRNGRYEKGDANLGRSTGFSMLDLEKLKKLSKKLFLGKTKIYVITSFENNGGKCQPIENDVGRKFLTCIIDRHWKLKNIGAPFDTRYWGDPAVKFTFDFELIHNSEVSDLNLIITDISERKKIYD